MANPTEQVLFKEDHPRMLKIIHLRWLTPLTLLILTILGFGLLIPTLGFYQDDWTQIWFGRAFGTQVYVDFFADVRPFIAWIYIFTTSLLGDNPSAWQIFGLFARFLAALISYILVRVIWAENNRAAAYVAVAYLIYPGFRQQFLPVMYSQYFIQYVISVLSIIFMVLALRSKKRYGVYTIFALLAAIFGLFTSEYFFGIELIRPLIIVIVLFEGAHEISISFLKRILNYWLPYILITIIFLFWRIFIFQFPTYQPIQIQFSSSNLGNTLSNLFELISTAFVESIRVSLLVWVENWDSLIRMKALTLDTVFIFGVACLGSLLAFLYFSRAANLDLYIRDSLQMLIIGTVGVVGAGIPFWFVGLSVNTIFYGGSRLLISFMLPASLLFGAILTILPSRVLANLVAALIVGMGLVRHLEDSLVYRDIQRVQASFFQQLAWRAPDIEPGTLLLVNHFQSGELMGDNSLTSAINFIYEKESPNNLNYVIFYIPDRLASGDLPGVEPGLDFDRIFHTTYFEGSTDKVLVLYFDPPSCLRILDLELDTKLPKPPLMPITLYDAANISNLEQINVASGEEKILPTWLFKYIYPEDSWCFFYEKADLARQEKDWGEIISLAEIVRITASKAKSTWELIPFIEGFSRSGEWVQAEKLTLDAMNKPKQSRRLTASILCRAWTVLINDPESNDLYRKKAGSIRAELDCENYAW